MKVNLRSRLRGTHRTVEPGVYECSEQEAKALIAAGAAEPLGHECAALDPEVETAVKPRGRKRRAKRGPQANDST